MTLCAKWTVAPGTGGSNGGTSGGTGGTPSAIQAQAGSQLALTLTPAGADRLNARQKEATGRSPVYDLTLKSGAAITDLKCGCAAVSLPYTLAVGQTPAGVVVYHLDSTNRTTPCKTVYDTQSRSVTFTTGHLSLYFVGDASAAAWENPYSDLSQDAWCYGAVRFVSERGLMGGFGDGRFGPNEKLSRAQFAQILYNRAGRPAVTGGTFTDVAKGAWCADAAAWAAAAGIAGGYALEALRWAVENNILSGREDGTLAPPEPATRAQAAQILKNDMEV